MADYGIKILKPNAPSGVDVNNAQKKDLIIISTADSHKLHSKITTTSSSVSNPLGYICYVESYVDNGDGSYSPVKSYLTTSNIYFYYYLSYTKIHLVYYEGNN